MATDSKIKFELEIEGVPPAALVFVAFQLEERVSECYCMEVDLLSGRIDPELLLGRKTTLYVRFEGDPERMFHGVIWSAQLTPRDDKSFDLHVQVVPRLYTLSLGRNSRVYKDSTLIAAVQDVLKKAGLPKEAFDWQAKEGPKHPMILQYDESDYDFVRRLLAEEGIGFLVQNDPDQERVIFFESDKALLAVDGITTLVDRRRQDARADSVFDLREEVSTTPDAVMLREYDVKNPSKSPDGNAALGDDSSRQVYQHPGGHLVLASRAQRTLDALALPARSFRGGSYWPQLEPGRYVTLDSELRPSLQGDIVLLSVAHEGQLHKGSSPVAYRNQFVAVPKTTPLRPAHVPPAPVLAGAQRAFVTGPGGQEMHGDELGRVNVRFPWDRSGNRDDKSSAPIRVGQLQLSGSMIIPRVGFEVVVGHELGDLDRPYATGHMYTQEAPAPYGSANLTTTSIQTATTDGGAGANELRLNTSAGAEEILMNASYDMSIKVENTLNWTVTKNEKLEIGANAKLSVKDKSTANVTGNQTLDVAAMQDTSVGANLSEGVTGNQSMTVGAARKATIGGDQVETVGGTLQRKIGAAQTVVVVDGFTRKITGNSTVNVGAAWAETIAKSKSSTVSGARVEQVGALKLISAKQVGIVADAAYGEQVASQKVKTAKDRADSSGGKLKIEAKGGASFDADNITFTAEDELTFSAGKVTITLKRTGDIEVKADEIAIKGAKALKQITHKTN